MLFLTCFVTIINKRILQCNAVARLIFLHKLQKILTKSPEWHTFLFFSKVFSGFQKRTKKMSKIENPFIESEKNHAALHN